MTTKRGRPRRGHLYYTKSGWRVRMTVDVEGVSVQKSFDLGTHVRAVAKVKAKRLEQAEPNAKQARRVETFEEAAERVVRQLGKEGMKTWPDRLSRLRRFAFEALGPLPVTEIRAAHVREVLRGGADLGLSKQSLAHLRNDLSSVLGDLWRDEVIAENPVARVRLPKDAKVDRRPRLILSDDEFARFAATEGVPEQLYLMALASRSFGGMRTSDLHAWDWSHVDLETWQSAEVYRPKTDGLEETTVLARLAMPGVLERPLRAWWTTRGKPTAGPVFPIRTGKRAGERQGKRSHARELRDWLWRAGIHRPLEGFEQAMAALRASEDRLAELRRANAKGEVREAQRAALEARVAAKACDELQAGSDRFQAVDFHSFRRQFNTALAAAGVTIQQAMPLAGHKDPRTHARYVQLAQRGILVTPDAALPVLFSASFMHKMPGPDDQPIANPAVLTSDPNEIRTRVTGVRGRCPNH